MRRAEYAAVVVVVLGGLATVVGFYEGWWSITVLSGALLGLIFAVVLIVVAWGFGPRIRDWTKRNRLAAAVEPPSDRPKIAVEVLPHFKGYILPPKVETKIGPGEVSSPLMTNVGASSRDRGKMAPSQVIDVYWPGPEWKNLGSTHDAFLKGVKWETLPVRSLIVKFGVLRISVSDADAIGCRVAVRFRVTEDALHVWAPARAVDGGYANWYSTALTMKLLQDDETHKEIDERRGAGVNKYLKNTIEDIHPGETRDLLLFYMIKDQPSVYLCTDVDTMPVGMSFDDKPVRFDLELSISAQRLPRTTFTYRVTAAWDDFAIEQASHLARDN